MRGEFEANTDALDQAANQLDEAAGEADIAGDRTGEGVAPADAFGRTAQAAELAAKWNAAVQARVTETRYSATETRGLAERLRQQSAEYRRMDGGGADRFNDRFDN